MPVSKAFAESNRSQTERMRRLVQRLNPAMLAARLPNGWTVAGALGHLAFWDRLRLCLMRRWAAGDFCSGAYDTDLFNETVQPLLEMIPPERVAAAPVKTAEEEFFSHNRQSRSSYVRSDIRHALAPVGTHWPSRSAAFASPDLSRMSDLTYSTLSGG